MEEKYVYWYNYRVGKYEWREVPTDFSDYVPTLGVNLYRLYVEDGLEPIMAAKKVLEIASGIKDE